MIIYGRFLVLIGTRHQVTRQETNNLSTDEKFPAANDNKYFFQHAIVLSQIILFLKGLFTGSIAGMAFGLCC